MRRPSCFTAAAALLPAFAWADAIAPSNPACRVDQPWIQSRTYTSSRPEFFFRPIYGTDPLKVSFITPGSNAILDLSTGAQSDIPGGVDPVPTPDGRYMSIPGGGMDFFRVAGLNRSSERLPGGNDPDADGVYQSIGSVASGSDSSTYRMITDHNGVSTRDYRINHGTGQVEALGAERRLCPGENLSLPMLSKDGRKLAALDNGSHPPVTRVFSLTPDGDCSDTSAPINLGIGTGKVDFAFGNSNLITFSARNRETLEGGYFTQPDDAFVSNAYVLDLSTGSTKRLTANTSSNSVYPNFLPDGRVVYLDHPRGADEGEPENSSFVVADPRTAPEGTWAPWSSLCATDADSRRRFNAQIALGSLWARICSRFGDEIGAASAAMTPLSLEPERCRRMVDDFWEHHRTGVLGSATLRDEGQVRLTGMAADLATELTADVLKAACPSAAIPKSTTGAPTVVGEVSRPAGEAPTAGGGDADALARITPVPPPTSCTRCHSAFPYDKPVDLAAKVSGKRAWVDEALCQMESGGMPMSQTPTERADYYDLSTEPPRPSAKTIAFKEYLKNIMRAGGRDPDVLLNTCRASP